MDIMNIRTRLVQFAFNGCFLVEILTSCNIPVFRPVIVGAYAVMKHDHRFSFSNTVRKKTGLFRCYVLPHMVKHKHIITVPVFGQKHS